MHYRLGEKRLLQPHHWKRTEVLGRRMLGVQIRTSDRFFLYLGSKELTVHGTRDAEALQYFKKTWEFLLWLSGLSTRLVFLRMWVRSLGSLGGLRIQPCCELWCRSQKPLGSCIAAAVVQAKSCSSDSTSSLGTSICRRYGPKKKKKKKKNFNDFKENLSFRVPFLPFWVGDAGWVCKGKGSAA